MSSDARDVTVKDHLYAFVDRARKPSPLASLARRPRIVHVTFDLRSDNESVVSRTLSIAGITYLQFATRNASCDFACDLGSPLSAARLFKRNSGRRRSHDENYRATSLSLILP
jgi:hypothetical protein